MCSPFYFIFILSPQGTCIVHETTSGTGNRLSRLKGRRHHHVAGHQPGGVDILSTSARINKSASSTQVLPPDNRIVRGIEPRLSA
jgi:hypothetical protein